MASPRRQTLVDAIKTRFQGILTAGGYETNLGSNVTVWRCGDFTDDELEALDIRDTEDNTSEEILTKHHHQLTIEVRAVDKTATASAATGRKMIADILKAVSTDRKWSAIAFNTTPGKTDMSVEQSGKTVVKVFVSFTVHYRTQPFNDYQAA
jgi:hypothetical protein